jgi:hypothetical protein
LSPICADWRRASTELILDSVDYAGGDYYGGYLQQTFINKCYKSVSPNLPFIYHTARCDPDLLHHTTTKTQEELLIHVITALVHNGAFLLVDTINPDGTFHELLYTDLMKRIYAQTKKYEELVSGDSIHDVAIWISTHSKYDLRDSGKMVNEELTYKQTYLDYPCKMASILRQNNIPFDVVGSKNLKNLKAKTLVLSNVASILDSEMDDIENYVTEGGSLYVSGPIGHKRLCDLLGVNTAGVTQHNFTYMSPTPARASYFEGFSKHEPLTIPMQQQIVEVTGDCEVLATVTFPYTMTETDQFSAIHSNPPGVYTDMPAVILKKVGKGKILWAAAASIEATQPYMSRNVVKRLLDTLTGSYSFSSNAPAFVEIIGWHKAGRTFFAAINQQEIAPIAPMYDIYIDVPYMMTEAKLLNTGEALVLERQNGHTKIKLPKLEVFHIVEIIQ